MCCLQDHHNVSWRHPTSKHCHQLDLIITRRKDPNCVLHSRSYHSADCDTDHCPLIASKVKFIPKKIHHSKTKGKPRINTCCIGHSEKTELFLSNLNEALEIPPEDDTVESKWSIIRDAMYNSAKSAYGKCE